MLASNGTSKPLPNSNGGICSHYPPRWRSLRVFYSLGIFPFSKLKSKSYYLEQSILILKIFVGLSLNPLNRTTTCVHLHSIFQLSQCAHPLADFPLVYRLYTVPSSLTPALRSRVGLAPLRLP